MSYFSTFIKSKKYNPGAFAVLGFFIISLFLMGSGIGANADTVSYLQSHSDNAWASMALVAAGEPVDVSYLQDFSGSGAIDYAAPILALTAAGEDPRTYPNTNLVEALLSFHSGSQIGDSGLVNDDIFSLLALVSAGVSESDPAAIDAKNFILSNQNSDGGWGYSTGSGSDTNTTAAAIMALRAVGVSVGNSVLTDAKSYLQSAQNDDGGFPYDPVSPWGYRLRLIVRCVGGFSYICTGRKPE